MTHPAITIIAEAGVNHNGDAEMALALVDAAAAAGADVVKFQTFKADAMIAASAPKARYQVESRRGAVAWALWASLRFLSPLIKPDVRISRIRLPDRLHLKAHGGGPRWTRLCRITPSSPNTTVSGKPGATRRHLMAPDQEMTYSLVRSSSLIPDNQFGSPAPPSP